MLSLRVVALVVFACSASPVRAQTGPPRNDLPQPYTTTRTWGELPPGVKWAAVTAIEPAPDGTIYVVHRCLENSCAGRSEAPILKYNAAGKLLASFGQGRLIFPHGGTVDRDGNLWMTDAGSAPGKGHQAIKFSPDGKILMTLGKAGVSGSGPDLFDQPTDVVVAPNGDLFITDSHRNGKNNRVMHFTKDGKFIKEWGRKGSGRGELSEPHTMAMDSRGRLFVGDRENNRIVIYDQNGQVLDEWRQFGRPSGIVITPDDTIYVADSESWGTDTGARELPGIKKGIRIGSAKDGRVTAFIEDQESTAADHSGAEGVGVDAAGNVYGGVVRRRMLERHVKRQPDPRLASPESVKDTGFWVEPSKAERVTKMFTYGPDQRIMTAPNQGDPTSKLAFLSGSGGLLSTTDDYRRFAQMLLDGGQASAVAAADLTQIRTSLRIASRNPLRISRWTAGNLRL